MKLIASELQARDQWLCDQLTRARLDLAGRVYLTRHKPGWSQTRGPFSDYDLHYVFSGAVEYVFPEQTLRARAGSFCLLPPGKTFIEQDVKNGCGASFCYAHFLFSLAGGLDPLRAVCFPAVIRPPKAMHATQRCRSLLACARRAQWSELVMKAQFLEMLALMLQSGFGNGVLSFDASRFGPEWLFPVLRVLEERLGDPELDLDALAARAHLSPSHFAHAFRRYVGIAPKRLILQKRLDRACELLLSKEGLSIKEIGRQCGFTDPYHFSAQFRKALSLSPSTWRDSH